ncbi:response regulator [Rhizobium sp. L1K21]|uniref:response regulator n=1 Tax=Rhizobium sp. L1K21 TaxID=2954933 RepID=UPI002092B243|nr:response regulator [Rhizobium sp. L1K21]MCO6186283.1 response regulator [Rhizobium sp. L1K21]
MAGVYKMDGSLQVLVVEDEPMIAWMLEDAITSLGCDVVGPFPSVREALNALENERPKIALLDVNLVDGEVYPLADRLHELSVPLIFHTANVRGDDLATRYMNSQTVMKPSDPTMLESAINAAKAQLSA